MTAVRTALAPDATVPRRYDGDGATSRVDRYVWRPVVVGPPSGPARPVAGRSALVVGGTTRTQQRMVDVLTAAGARASALAPPGEDEAPDAVASRTTAALRLWGPVDVVIDLNLAPAMFPDPSGAWRAALAQTVAVLQAVYGDWSGEQDARRCGYLAVTTMGGRMGYDGNGVAQPLGGVWAGLAKSLPHEMPACRIKVVDVAAAELAALPEIVLAELQVADYFEVGWRGGTRVTLGCRRESAAPPRLDLGAGDLVLVSGGGRGVGFELACELARRGARVVVTGRRALPAPRDAAGLAELDDEAFQSWLRERLRAAAGGDVAAARRENDGLAAVRDVLANLARAARQGLAVEYRVCDVTDRDQVRALVDELGAGLRVVVHNAGIAAPVRLARKSIATVLDVVACKLEGFLALADALAGHPVELVCNVGSAAGRLGGMPGQVDYAAANEVLARLGFWAGEQRGLQVTTLAWTTWNRVGLIANFDAALRYGAAVTVEDGLARWVGELAGGAPGEVMFLGRVGTALVPAQLAGFLGFTDHPDLPRLHSLRHFLGDVEEYVPFARVRSRVRLAPGPPLDREVLLDGRPILPVSVALEYAVSVGDWVAPEGWPPRRLAEVRDVEADLRTLTWSADGLELVRAGRGSRQPDGRWAVEVGMSLPDRTSVLQARLLYDESTQVPKGMPSGAPSPPAEALPPSGPARGGRAGSRPDPLGLRWSGIAFPAAAAQTTGCAGSWVPPSSPADLWALPHTPEHRLPTAALETVLAAAAREDAAPSSPSRLVADALVFAPGGPPVRVDGARGRWQITDGAGRAVLRITGLVLS